MSETGEAPAIRGEQAGRDPTTGRFLPGVSGNPNGRPSDSKRLREMARQLGERALEGLLREAEDADSAAARIAAWNAILDRGFGKPTVGEPGDDGRQVSEVVYRWADGGTDGT